MQPDNRVGVQIDLNHLANDRRIRRELFLPQTVAKYGFRCAQSLIGRGRQKGTAEDRTDSEHLKIIRGRQRPINALRLARYR